MCEPPEGSERSNRFDEGADRGRVGDVARDTRRAIDVRCLQVDGDQMVGGSPQAFQAGPAHAAGRAGDHSDGGHRR